jgi:hypothetical protein
MLQEVLWLTNLIGQFEPFDAGLSRSNGLVLTGQSISSPRTLSRTALHISELIPFIMNSALVAWTSVDGGLATESVIESPLLLHISFKELDNRLSLSLPCGGH